jgi:hypothetical protein
MNKFRNLGLIEYNGHLKVHNAFWCRRPRLKPSIRPYYNHLAAASGKLWVVCGLGFDPRIATIVQIPQRPDLIRSAIASRCTSWCLIAG